MSSLKERFSFKGKRGFYAGVGIASVLAVAGAGWVYLSPPAKVPSEVSAQSRVKNSRYMTSPAEWASLTIETIKPYEFRAEHLTEGKVAIDEDRSTPVFSPYAGRVTRLLVRPGEQVTQGQPLFMIEAADTVQAQNDFVAAATALNKAVSQLELAQIQDKRAKDLFDGKAIPLKDFQQSQATLISAQNDMRAAETGLEAARNRLRILGLNETAIDAFQNKGQIDREITVHAPLAGTVVQRKVGPGQYVGASSSDPVFVIGDLSTVWLTAYVRESEAADVAVGQQMKFKVLALPNREFSGRINYVATSIDPSSRRLLVRATADNSNGALKPEMYASVTIYSAAEGQTVGVPRQALVYEGDKVRVWVAHDDKSIELRLIKTGMINGNLVEVLTNLKPGEKIVTKGALFIDRAASS